MTPIIDPLWGGGVCGSEKQVVAHIPIVTFRFKLFEWYKSLPSVNFLEWLKRVLKVLKSGLEIHLLYCEAIKRWFGKVTLGSPHLGGGSHSPLLSAYQRPIGWSCYYVGIWGT